MGTLHETVKREGYHRASTLSHIRSSMTKATATVDQTVSYCPRICNQHTENGCRTQLIAGSFKLQALGYAEGGVSKRTSLHDPLRMVRIDRCLEAKLVREGNSCCCVAFFAVEVAYFHRGMPTRFQRYMVLSFDGCLSGV